MNIVVKKPILVAGITLSFLLWFGQKMTNYWDEISNISIFSLICLGGISYILRKFGQKKVNSPSFLEITIQDLSAKITNIKNQINSLASEVTVSENKDNKDNKKVDFGYFQQKLNNIENSFPRENINIGILNLNQKTNGFQLTQHLEKIFSQSINFSLISDVFNTLNNLTENQSNELILNYDLIIFIVNEDLTQSQKEIINICKSHQQNLLVAFDDFSYTLPEEKKLVFQSIKQALDSFIEDSYILSISSKQQVIKVRKYKDENEYQEWEETSNINYQSLIDIIKILGEKEGEKLVLSTAYRNAIDLEREVRKELNNIRRSKSLAVIEKYQIVAATATFANPVSSLDLLATAAINTQMIVDLSKIYQYPLSLNQAQQISLELAKVMVKLGVVEISTQTITAILKTNLITFVAGGVIQGVSAAYLTRLCALSLMEYYEVAELNVDQGINISKIKEKIGEIFAQNKANNFFDNFVKKTTLLFN